MNKKPKSVPICGIQRVNPRRRRNPVSQDLIDNLKKRLNEMPQNTFKYKECNEEYWWRGHKKDNRLPKICIDLPIVYGGEDYETIDYSCIVLDKETNRILAVFIYHTEDENIALCLENAHELAEKMNYYCREKPHTFYSGFSSTKCKETGKQIKKTEDRTHYGGKNWLEGQQRYLDGVSGKNVVCFYPRKETACEDKEYMSELLWLYCSLYELEKRHCPALAKHRYDLAKNCDSLGAFPPVPIDIAPFTCVGGSKNFWNKPHNDSSVEGTCETIIWKDDPETEETYKFVNHIGKKVFILNKPCMIYQVGNDLHNTMNTGNHGGVGFVILSKKNLLSNSDFLYSWNQEWLNYFFDKSLNIL